MCHPNNYNRDQHINFGNNPTEGNGNNEDNGNNTDGNHNRGAGGGGGGGGDGGNNQAQRDGSENNVAIIANNDLIPLLLNLFIANNSNAAAAAVAQANGGGGGENDMVTVRYEAEVPRPVTTADPRPVTLQVTRARNNQQVRYISNSNIQTQIVSRMNNGVTNFVRCFADRQIKLYLSNVSGGERGIWQIGWQSAYDLASNDFPTIIAFYSMDSFSDRQLRGLEGEGHATYFRSLITSYDMNSQIFVYAVCKMVPQVDEFHKSWDVHSLPPEGSDRGMSTVDARTVIQRTLPFRTSQNYPLGIFSYMVFHYGDRCVYCRNAAIITCSHCRCVQYCSSSSCQQRHRDEHIMYCAEAKAIKDADEEMPL